MPGIAIHPQLLADCHVLGRFNLCQVLLNKNALLPWFILVPQCDGSDLLDLDSQARAVAMDEAALLSRFVKTQLGYPKINFAAIGNIVPQLHLHIVGRKPGDGCWPAPVWGHLAQTEQYPAVRVEEIRDLLARDYALKIET